MNKKERIKKEMEECRKLHERGYYTPMQRQYVIGFIVDQIEEKREAEATKK